MTRTGHFFRAHLDRLRTFGLLTAAFVLIVGLFGAAAMLFFRLAVAGRSRYTLTPAISDFGVALLALGGALVAAVVILRWRHVLFGLYRLSIALATILLLVLLTLISWQAPLAGMVLGLIGAPLLFLAHRALTRRLERQPGRFLQVIGTGLRLLDLGCLLATFLAPLLFLLRRLAWL